MMEEEILPEEEEEEDWSSAWNEIDPQCQKNDSSDTSLTSIDQTKMVTMTTVESYVPVPSRMLLNDNKAGMEGLDKEKINQIIMENSKGSKFYENERKKEENVNKRIVEQQKKLADITPAQLKTGLVQANRLLEEIESMRMLDHVIVHIDMDAFYAAVEMRDNPSLRNKPMAVGGLSMLSTSNYLARKFGVRAAMPGFIGKKLCPDLIIVPANFEKYTSVSKQVREVLSDYDPNFCPMSLDEAYLDITKHLEKRKVMTELRRTYLVHKTQNEHSICLCEMNETLKQSMDVALACDRGESDNIERHETSEPLNSDCNGNLSIKEESDNSVGSSRTKVSTCEICGKSYPEYETVTFGISADEAVREIRCRIEQQTRLTASAGIAPNMMLAKVCSDKNKPNGQYKIPCTREAVMTFVKDLSIRKISGIGKVTEQMLNALGIHTASDLYQQRALLYHLYSNISFQYFMRISLGIGSTTVERESCRKSISTERTFREINQPAELFVKCKELCEALVEDLKEEGYMGKTVGIKVKTIKFDVRTRVQTIPDYTGDLETIYKVASDLLKIEIQNAAPQPLRLRLMGVRMSGLLHHDQYKKQQNTLTSLLKNMKKDKQSNSSSLTLTQDVLENKQNASSFPEMCWVSDECSSIQEGGGISSGGVEKDISYTSAETTEIVIQNMNDAEMKLMKKEKVTVNTSGAKSFEKPSFEEFIPSAKSVGDRLNNLMNIAIEDKKQNPDLGVLNNFKNECTETSIQSSKSLDSKLSKDLTQEDRNEVVMPTSKEIISYDNSQVSDVHQFHISKEEIEPSSAVNTCSPLSSLNQDSNDYDCPVCGRIINDSLSNFNSHIDVCLNRNIVKECSRYEPTSQIPKHYNSPGTLKKSIKKSRKMHELIMKKTLNIPVHSEKCIMHSPEAISVDSNNKEENPNLIEKTANNVMPNMMVCPVCFMSQSAGNLEIFNQHVDSCLSKDTITQILTEQKSSEKNDNKRPSNSPSVPYAKRKRQNSGIVKSANIVSFFKSTK